MWRSADFDCLFIFIAYNMLDKSPVIFMWLAQTTIRWHGRTQVQERLLSVAPFLPCYWMSCYEFIQIYVIYYVPPDLNKPIFMWLVIYRYIAIDLVLWQLSNHTERMYDLIFWTGNIWAWNGWTFSFYVRLNTCNNQSRPSSARRFPT